MTDILADTDDDQAATPEASPAEPPPPRPSILSRIVRRLSGRPFGLMSTIAEPSTHGPSPLAITDHAIDAYEDLVTQKLAEHPDDRELALAQCIGSLTMDIFRSQGDGHVEVLKYHGLKDGMAIYDLGAGCGRTAQALLRSGWQGHYIGADIVARLIDELKDKCPDYEAHTHRRLSLIAADASLDIVFHWSVFTHLFPEQCYIYMKDTRRALKPDGKLIFSFLEMEAPQQERVFDARVLAYENNAPLAHLDTFLHRDWIRKWAANLGFSEPQFTDGNDASRHMPFWQTLAIMEKL